MKKIYRCLYLVPLLFSLLLSSCAAPLKGPLHDHALVYSISSDTDLLGRYSPVFIVEEAGKGHNKIGTVRALEEPEGHDKVFVDPEVSTIYTSIRKFETDRDRYTNLLYRIHFSEVPSGVTPFYLGAGKNVGLIVIVTLDSRQRPVLYTLVHTCGCYLAFIPTSYLSEDLMAAGWFSGRQSVYGENLPSMIDFTQDGATLLAVQLRTATHRIKNVWLSTEQELQDYMVVHPDILPFDYLEYLPLAEGRHTSFFETAGPRFGYVKGSHKIWERLLISWWSFDWRVGEDKKLGRDKSDGIVFYTSLKPWAREASDLRDFPRFLKYWGWRL